MTINDFIDIIKSSSNDKIRGIVECAINDFQKIDDYDEITQKIQGIDSKDFTDFGDKIATCIHICETKLNDIEGLHDPYGEKLKSFRDTLNKIVSIIQAEGRARSSKQPGKDTNYALAQNLEVIHEQITKINNAQQSANEALSEVKKTRAELDSRIFQLLINTVAILGIFVAIAFTGFGVASIISNIDLKTALGSEEAFVKNIFFLLLVTSLLYNLLLLLVYFVFKLSRPLFNQINPDSNEPFEKQKEKTFKEIINLRPFYVVDGALALLTVASFLASIWIW